MDSTLDRQLLLQLAGELRATRFVVSTLIATHPDIDTLAERFGEMKPDLVDDIIDGPHPTSEPEREGWKRVLADTTTLIEALRG